MALNENIVIRLMADSTDYTAKMQAASASATQLSKSLERPMSTSERLGAMAQKTGLVVGALSAAVGVAAVKAFADFDASMSAVKTNTGATGSELDQLKQAALDAGAKTVFSATESADAINELAKAGVSTKDILSGGLQGALDLAASGQMGVADAAELTASALNEFGLKGNKASHVADLLAAGAATAQGGVGDMGEALKMVGVTASQTGMSIEDTTGALTMMASKGITGSDAGTQLRSALIGLTSASGPAKKMMQELGISMYDSGGQFVGLANFAGQLQDKLSKLTPEQRANAMGVLFSNAAMSVGNTLYEQGAKGVEGFTDQVNKQGFAAKQAADLTDNLKGDVEQFGGAVETSLIKIGSGANGPIRSAVQHVTNLVTAFGDLPAPAQQGVIGIGLLVGAVAGLHKVLGPLSQSTSGFSKAMSAAFDPVQRMQGATSGFSEALELMRMSTKSSGDQLAVLGHSAEAPKLRMDALKAAGGGVVDLLGGPWGIAMTVAGAALISFAQRHEQAKERVDNLTESLNKGETATAYFEKTLSDSSASVYTASAIDRLTNGYDNLWKAVDQAGISHQTYIRAIQGDAAATDEVHKQADAYANSLGLMGQMFDGTSHTIYGGLAEQQGAWKKAQKAKEEDAKASQQNSAEQTQNALATAGLTKATKEGADAQADAADKTAKNVDANQILADAFDATTKGISNQANELGEVIDALKTYYGFAISASDADISLHDSFDKATESIKKNGANLDINTEKGRDNMKALNDVAKSAMQSAEAHARAGDDMTKIGPLMDDARNRLVQYAQQMGKTPEEANAFADSVGLSSNAVQDLVNKVQKANGEPLQPVKVSVDSGDASRALDELSVKAKVLEDGQTIQITGDNKAAMKAISEVTGAKIDPKKGTLDLDKHQYDIALALANGATINKKTGEIEGNNSDFWKKLAEANGWKINPKNCVISADGKPFKVEADKVDKWEPATKSIKITDDASKTLERVKLKVQTMPNGKTMRITGENKDAMLAIHEVTGAKIDDKHSKLTMDKHQYDMALALANGAKIDPKTGQLKGDNSDHWRKIAQSNGWKIDPKTGVISGNDGPFQATKKAVDNATIKGKKVEVGAETSSFWDTINGILGRTFHINIGATQGKATGGLITGPGTGTSDDITARLSNGEYVITADRVRALGVDFFDAINYGGAWQRYATGGYVQKYAATPVTPNPVSAQPEARIVYEQPVTFNQHVVRDPNAQSALDAAKVRHLTAGLLRKGGML
ncbi:phage tail tape measure protein [Bifidobacterium indicum]|uniref:phage tail tape measure protein n=1 Tax=Bifidobacterium indicum TaxID=1691 RepID=UPI0030DBD8A4